jgi:hypothetical protein
MAQCGGRFRCRSHRRVGISEGCCGTGNVESVSAAERTVFGGPLIEPTTE